LSPSIFSTLPEDSASHA